MTLIWTSYPVWLFCRQELASFLLSLLHHNMNHKMKIQNPISFCAFWFMFLQAILVLCVSFMLQPTSNFVSAMGNETDRIALLKFKESVSDDPQGFLRSWNVSLHFCHWHGISCGKRHQRVTSLDLEAHNLRGTISPYLGNLTFLRLLNLMNNSFSGEIPTQIGRLFRLQNLILSYNKLEGNIPVNLSHCLELKVMVIGNNKLTGAIPLELGSLVKLKLLNLEVNNLTGGIPSSFGNMSSLQGMYLSFNNLGGTVPDELGRLQKLNVFSIGPNNLSGKIPLSLYNKSSLTNISLVDNQFEGTLPPNIGLTLPNLQEIFIAGNEFSGIIPESISNASQLQLIDLGENNFGGQVPASFGNLVDLRGLLLSANNLGNYSANSLDFIVPLTNCSHLEWLVLASNRFGGLLPNSIANFSTQLTRIYLGGNQISGNIPPSLENLINLIALSMEGNLFTGAVPDSLGKLTNLQMLALDMNKLSGKIPTSIGNLTNIFSLSLSHNKLEGSIPPSIVECQNLQHIDMSSNRLGGAIPKGVFHLYSSLSLNLSRNLLSGSLPVEVGKLNQMQALDLSENSLTGDIPETIGDCESLESLYLQGNFFRGTLPLDFASLKGLQYLDVSRNKLTGTIPKNLGKLRFLLYLNMSFNDLEGEVPDSGIFQNISAVSVVGNTKLCGGVSKLQLQECPIKESKEGNTSGLKATIIIVCLAAIFLLLSGLVIFYCKRKSRRKSSILGSTISFLPEVSYKKLYQATSGFSPSMLIGIGSFGTVYKGIFDEKENPVAIKVFNLQRSGAEKIFVAECNALRNIRHRNLVKILTCCSSMDYNGNDFKALIFEFMPNGSLENWLHPVTIIENRSNGLNFIQKLNVAVDVACAICYLHDDCDPPIIHCDLKPSNVLLDSEMMAHIGDFGLARLIPNTISFSRSQISTSGTKGTIGYVPPEYAMGGEPSKQGDVYSYGILLLEMFTGRRPTDEIFKDDFNLRNFVKMALLEGLVNVVDSALLFQELEETTSSTGEERNNFNRDVAIDVEEREITFEMPNEISAYLQKCLVLVLEIGVACSEESPNQRMLMGDVVRELQRIRNAYMSVLR